MELTTSTRAGTRTLTLSGRLDALSAGALEQDWFDSDVRALVVDLQQCEYVSSAGLRSFLRLHREAHGRSASLTLTNVSPFVYDVLELTGLTRMLTVRRLPREISIEGLEFLSAGLCGECFRLDSETIVKLYNEGVAAEVAEQEKAYATAAFVAGVSTALSYDIVRCGSRTGVIYEMLDAELFSAVIRRTPQAVDAHARLLAQIAHSFHSRTADPTVFPDLQARLRDHIGRLADALPAADVDLLQARLAAIPAGDTLVHFDLHTSNIMLRQGEPVVIDMGDVSRGHYLFDIGLMTTIYAYPETGGSALVTKVPDALGRTLYEGFLDHYFARRTAAERAFFERNEAFLGALRLVSAAAFLPGSRDILVAKIRDEFLPRIRAEAGRGLAAMNEG